MPCPSHLHSHLEQGLNAAATCLLQAGSPNPAPVGSFALDSRASPAIARRTRPRPPLHSLNQNARWEIWVYVSLDAGGSWQPLRLNLPVAPVHDLVVKDGDLVAATHGRSFWILDDVTPIREMTDEALGGDAYLFEPRPAYRGLKMLGKIAPERIGPGKNYWVAIGVPATFKEETAPDGSATRAFLDAGHNPPDGAVVTYYLGDQPEDGAALMFIDPDGREVRRFTDVPAEQGMNRFVWDMRHRGPRTAPGDDDSCLIAGPNPPGPLVTPGAYTVRLEVGGETLTRRLEALKAPRSEASDSDLAEQLALLLRIRDRLSEVNDAVNELRSVRGQVGEWLARAGASEEMAAAGRAIVERLDDVEGRLIATWRTSERGQMGTPLPKAGRGARHAGQRRR